MADPQIADALTDAVPGIVKTSGAGGADWQVAIVSAVGTDGTISADTATGTVPKVRLVCNPVQLSDAVEISQNAAGNWLCHGYLRDGTDDTTWVNLSYPTGYARYSGNSTAFQIKRTGSRVAIRGRILLNSGNIPVGENVLPGLALASKYRPTQSPTNTSCYVELVLTTANTAACPSGTVRAQARGDGAILTELHSSMTAQTWVGFGEGAAWYVD